MAFEHEDYMAARRRRFESNAMIARNDPGRFSSFERNALLGMQHTKSGDIAYVDRQERQGLQDFELARLRQQGENELKVAEQKRFGMAEQGMKAAEFGANAEIKKAETEWGARKDIAQTEAEAKKYGADRGLTAAELEWGKTGADGTRIGGGREAVAGIEGKSRVDAAREQAKIAAEQNEQKRALEEQKIVSTIQRAAIQSQGKIDAAKIGAYSKEVSAALQAGGMNGKDTATVLAELREAHKDDPGWNAVLDSLGGGQNHGKKVRSYRYNADRTKRIPVYEDGSQGPAEDVK